MNGEEMDRKTKKKKTPKTQNLTLFKEHTSSGHGAGPLGRLEAHHIQTLVKDRLVGEAAIRANSRSNVPAAMTRFLMWPPSPAMLPRVQTADSIALGMVEVLHRCTSPGSTSISLNCDVIAPLQDAMLLTILVPISFEENCCHFFFDFSFVEKARNSWDQASSKL